MDGIAQPGGTCEGDLSATFRSLRRDVRQAFLMAHPGAVVPSYSIAAVSDRTSTSKMLLESWQLLSVFDKREDGQLIQTDTFLPGASFLERRKPTTLQSRSRSSCRAIRGCCLCWIETATRARHSSRR